VLTAEELRRVLHYNPETGRFTWLVKTNSRGGGVKVGDAAGYRDGDYCHIRIGGRLYKAHRLAWFYVYGKWPSRHLDHRDRDGGNNSLANLREATRSQNMANMKGRSPHGKGVRKMAGGRRKPYLARITKDRAEINIGYFATPEEAHAAYETKARELFGEFARVA
jgi:hypothetical protein